MPSSLPNTAPQIKDFEALREGDVFGGNGFDAIAFRRKPEPESSVLDFKFMSFSDPQKTEFDDELGSYRWLVLLFEPTDGDDQFKVIYYQPYLGDALRFAKNQASSGGEGVMIKKSPAAFRIFHKVLTHSNPPKSFKPIADEVATDFQTYLEKLGLPKEELK